MAEKEKLSKELLRKIMEDLVDNDDLNPMDNTVIKTLIDTLIGDKMVASIRWSPMFDESEFIRMYSSPIAKAHHISDLDEVLPPYFYTDRDERYFILSKASDIFNKMRLEAMRHIGQFEETHYTDRFREIVSDYVSQDDRLTKDQKGYAGPLIFADVDLDCDGQKMNIYGLGQKGVDRNRISTLVQQSFTMSSDAFIDKFKGDTITQFPEIDPEEAHKTAIIMTEIYIRAMGAIAAEVIDIRNAL